MQRAPWFFALTFIVSFMARAQPAPHSQKSSPAQTKRKVVHVILAKEDSEVSTTRFSGDSIKIRALWKGENLAAGDKVHAIWIADDVGATAPRNTKIAEADVTAYKPDDDGIFSLQRPKEGWPAGKYRFEIYLNQKMEHGVNFAIEHGVTVEIGNPETANPSQTSAPLQLEPSPAVQPKQ